jgi:hypothetical protein
MPTIRQVLATKVALTLLVSLGLVFLPLTALPWLGLPAYDPPTLMFVRLLGVSAAALAVVEAFGCPARSSLRAAIVAALAQTVGISLVVWHFVFYGYLATWPVLGKMVVIGGGGVAILFVVLILLTGTGRLVGRAAPDDTATPGAVRP